MSCLLPSMPCHAMPCLLPYRNFLSVWNLGGPRKGCRKAPRPIFMYACFLMFSLVLYWFPMARWCGIYVSEQNGSIIWQFPFCSTNAENRKFHNIRKNAKIGNSQISLYFPCVSACFLLVSDGPMVRDFFNWTKRKVSYGSFSFV